MEYSFKDTDGDHVTLRYNSNGRLSIWLTTTSSAPT